MKLRINLSALAIAAVAAAQTPAQRPAFEAAVIKPNNSASNGSSSNGSKGQVVFTNASLRRLVERALNVKSFQVEGPAWMETVRFDIAAKYPVDTAQEDRPRMLKTLLEDRFGLVLHEESKMMPGYELVVAKGGFKLQPVEPGKGPSTGSNGDGKTTVLKVERGSMAGLADFLGHSVGSMVVDKTGLAGFYNYEIKWWDEQNSAVAKADEPEQGPSVFAAVQEVLGLKLQTAKVPTPVFIVDKLERTPNDN
jgi:uncharacterized protein (TIGR03435 family)